MHHFYPNTLKLLLKHFNLLLTIIVIFVSGNLTAQYKSQEILNLQSHHVHSSSIVELENGDLLTVWFELMDKGRERTSKNVKLMGSRLKNGHEKWSETFFMAETPFFPDGNPVLFLNGAKKLYLAWDVLQAEVWHAAALKVKTSTDYLGSGAPNWEWQDNIFLKNGELFVEEVSKKLQSAPQSNKMQLKSFKKYQKEILNATDDPVLRSIGWMTRLQPIILKSSPHKGRILLPLYNDSLKMSLCAISDDDGLTWTPSLPIVGRGNIQPALLEKENGDIVAFMRDAGGEYKIQTSTSKDNGYSWSAAEYIDIPNPNSSVEVKALKDGRWVMICNDMTNFVKTNTGCCDGRQQLSLYTSDDEGKNWVKKMMFEDDTNKPNKIEKRGRFHYPSMIQTQDGMLHIVYTYNKRETPYEDSNDNTIKHVVVDPETF